MTGKGVFYIVSYPITPLVYYKVGITNRYGDNNSVASSWGGEGDGSSHRLYEARACYIFRQVTHFFENCDFIYDLERYVLKKFQERRLHHSLIYNKEVKALSNLTSRSEIIFALIKQIFQAVIEYYQEKKKERKKKCYVFTARS